MTDNGAEQMTDNERRVDRAKAIRDERKCSLREAVEFERQEFEAANGGPLTGAALARWCYENPNLAAKTIEGLRAALAAARPDREGWQKYEEAMAALGGIIDAAEMYWDEGPPGEGWRSVEHKAACERARRVLDAYHEQGAPDSAKMTQKVKE